MVVVILFFRLRSFGAGLEIVIVDFFNSAADEHDRHQVETKTNERQDRREIFDLFDLGPDLGQSEKNADSHEDQKQAPHYLKVFFSIFHQMVKRLTIRFIVRIVQIITPPKRGCQTVCFFEKRRRGR